MSVNHCGALIASKTAIVTFTLKKLSTHADIVDVVVGLVDLAYRLRNSWVFCSVSFDVRADALTVESMLAGINEEFTVIEDRSKTDVAVLSRVDCYVSILHVPPLRSQLLRILRVLTDLATQVLDLFLIIIQAIAKVLFHVANLSLLWEQVKQVFHF